MRLCFVLYIWQKWTTSSWCPLSRNGITDYSNNHDNERVTYVYHALYAQAKLGHEIMCETVPMPNAPTHVVLLVSPVLIFRSINLTKPFIGAAAGTAWHHRQFVLSYHISGFVLRVREWFLHTVWPMFNPGKATKASLWAGLTSFCSPRLWTAKAA